MNATMVEAKTTEWVNKTLISQKKITAELLSERQSTGISRKTEKKLCDDCE